MFPKCRKADMDLGKLGTALAEPKQEFAMLGQPA